MVDNGVMAVDGEPDSRAEAARRMAAGERLKFLFFWGHRPPRGGGVGPGCLSQWWPAPFTVDGVTYPTAEHWMMAGKARLFGDAAAERRAVAAGHPREAKLAGRSVRGFDEETWARHRFALVVQGCVLKFGAHPELREYLLTTGRRVLVEASPLDAVWGIGLAADDERAADPARWPGLNLLGFALMAARQRLGATAEEDAGAGAGIDSGPEPARGPASGSTSTAEIPPS